MIIMSRIVTFRQALNEALVNEMERDSKVILLGEDIAGGAGIEHLDGDECEGGSMGATKGLVKKFGRNRVIDTPISESGYTGAALGAAMCGLRPVSELQFANFFGCAMDQIYNNIAKMRYMSGGQANAPLVIRMPNGGGWSAAGQHSDAIYSMMAHIPGIKTIVPSTPYDCKGLMISAIRDDDPVCFFEHITLYDTKGEVPEEEYTIPIGKADVKREGKDVTVVAIQKMVLHALEVADKCAKDGVELEVIDPRTLSPLDTDTIINSVKKTRRLIIVDEDHDRCSISSDISAIVSEQAFDYLESPVKRITAPHTHVPFSPVLENAYVPNPDLIYKTITNFLSE